MAEEGGDELPSTEDIYKHSFAICNKTRPALDVLSLTHRLWEMSKLRGSSCFCAADLPSRELASPFS